MWFVPTEAVSLQTNQPVGITIFSNTDGGGSGRSMGMASSWQKKKKPKTLHMCNARKQEVQTKPFPQPANPAGPHQPRRLPLLGPYRALRGAPGGCGDGGCGDGWRGNVGMDGGGMRGMDSAGSPHTSTPGAAGKTLAKVGEGWFEDGDGGPARLGGRRRAGRGGAAAAQGLTAAHLPRLRPRQSARRRPAAPERCHDHIR